MRCQRGLICRDFDRSSFQCVVRETPLFPPLRAAGFVLLPKWRVTGTHRLVVLGAGPRAYARIR
jgi:hypothetical protein